MRIININTGHELFQKSNNLRRVTTLVRWWVFTAPFWLVYEIFTGANILDILLLTVVTAGLIGYFLQVAYVTQGIEVNKKWVKVFRIGMWVYIGFTILNIILWFSFPKTSTENGVLDYNPIFAIISVFIYVYFFLKTKVLFTPEGMKMDKDYFKNHTDTPEYRETKKLADAKVKKNERQAITCLAVAFGLMIVAVIVTIMASQ